MTGDKKQSRSSGSVFAILLTLLLTKTENAVKSRGLWYARRDLNPRLEVWENY
nr:MAG TPA: hypothetical protein [Caudoviricetes sp.]